MATITDCFELTRDRARPVTRVLLGDRRRWSDVAGRATHEVRKLCKLKGEAIGEPCEGRPWRPVWLEVAGDGDRDVVSGALP